jgi:hypothetical protein
MELLNSRRVGFGNSQDYEDTTGVPARCHTPTMAVPVSDNLPVYSELQNSPEYTGLGGFAILLNVVSTPR